MTRVLSPSHPDVLVGAGPCAYPGRPLGDRPYIIQALRQGPARRHPHKGIKRARHLVR